MTHPAPRGDSCGCAGGALHPVDALSAEHRTILAVLDAADRELRRVDGGATPERAFWAGLLDFLVHYADDCHHQKEEDLLFAELERAGLPQTHGPTVCMRSEHETMRALRRQLELASDTGNTAALARVGHDLVDTLREHIDKEDRVLFPMAKQMLDHAAVARLREGFAHVEHEVMGEGTHCRYEELARSLSASGRAAPT